MWKLTGTSEQFQFLRFLIPKIEDKLSGLGELWSEHYIEFTGDELESAGFFKTNQEFVDFFDKTMVEFLEIKRIDAPDDGGYYIKCLFFGCELKPDKVDLKFILRLAPGIDWNDIIRLVRTHFKDSI